MTVKINDNTVQFKTALDSKAIKFLNEAKASLVSQTQRNTTVATKQLKESWGSDSYVDEKNLIAYIGSSLEYAIWYELGTGEYALKGDGRRGGWWIKVGNGKGEIPLTTVNRYKWDKIRKDKNGIPTFVFTTGMKPHRPLYNAFQTKGAKIQQQATRIYKEMNNL